MAIKPYFRHVPNFDYISRLAGSTNISDYIQVKNLFKRAKIRPDILEDLNHFTKYKIIGDERPDNIAYKVYNTPELDWLVMMSNNIINLEDEWPMDQQSFYNYLIKKYTNEAGIHSIHHYETTEIKDSSGRIIIKKGLEVPSDYTVSYYDSGLKAQQAITNFTESITNYTSEEELQNEKRNIFVLKSKYIGLILDDLKQIMPYKKGSTQFVSKTLVKGENIRLYN